jgi:hypothetical protein
MKKGGFDLYEDIYEKDLDGIETKKLCTIKRKKKGLVDSCFTKDEIDKMGKIIGSSGTPENILKDLRNHYKECGNDVCILKKSINDPEILKLAFKMRGPNKKYGWLSNYDIDEVFDYVSSELIPDFEYLGTYPRDFKRLKGAKINTIDINLEHLKKGKNTFAVIFNLDYSSGGGTHWVSMFIDTGNKSIEYVDSTGSKPYKEFINYINEVNQNLGGNYQIKYNNKEYQKGGSECGQFSIMFALARAYGMSYDEWINNPPDDHLANLYRSHFFRNAVKNGYIDDKENMYVKMDKNE